MTTIQEVIEGSEIKEAISRSNYSGDLAGNGWKAAIQMTPPNQMFLLV